MEFVRNIKPTLVGLVIGAVAVPLIGFTSLGWKLGSAAEHMAAQRAEAAVVKVLTPICVDRFRQQADYAVKLKELKDTAMWNRHALVEKSGWATIPGTDETHGAVAQACAERLGELSS